MNNEPECDISSMRVWEKLFVNIKEILQSDNKKEPMTSEKPRLLHSTSIKRPFRYQKMAFGADTRDRTSSLARFNPYKVANVADWPARNKCGVGADMDSGRGRLHQHG